MKQLRIAILSFVLLFASAPAFAKDMNFRFGPIGLLAGFINGELDFAVGSNWSVGPIVGFISRSSDNVDIDAGQIGLRADYYFNGTFTDGWYITPQVSIAGFDVTENDTLYGKLEDKVGGVIVSGMVGYNWFWDTFNMGVGGGLSTYTVDNLELKDSTGTVRDKYDRFSNLQLALEFNLGWTF